MAQPASLNAMVREQIRQYVAHCQALVERLQKLDASKGVALVTALNSALNGNGFLFVFRSVRGAIRPAGARTVWGALPRQLHVPSNVGRHYWQNALREQGLGARDIDRFMRHRVVGLENNTSSQSASPPDHFAFGTKAVISRVVQIGRASCRERV